MRWPSRERGNRRRGGVWGGRLGRRGGAWQWAAQRRRVADETASPEDGEAALPAPAVDRNSDSRHSAPRVERDRLLDLFFVSSRGCPWSHRLLSPAPSAIPHLWPSCWCGATRQRQGRRPGRAHAPRADSVWRVTAGLHGMCMGPRAEVFFVSLFVLCACAAPPLARATCGLLSRPPRGVPKCHFTFSRLCVCLKRVVWVWHR